MQIASSAPRMSPLSVIEPTCGTGAFILAALSAHPGLERIIGLEINPDHIAAARRTFVDPRIELVQTDIFTADLGAILDTLPDPVLAIGNPPWVTAAQLGRLHSANTPARSRRPGLSGLEAMTGRGNFDVSEWIVETLVEHLAGRDAMVRFVLKTSAARRIIEHCLHTSTPVRDCTIHCIDASAHFDAAVDACVLTLRTGAPAADDSCQVFDELASRNPSRRWAMRGGRLVADAIRYDATAHLAGPRTKLWRSGIKHDCARVMVLTPRGDHHVNGLGEVVNIEPDHLYPLINATQVARGRPPTRRIIVTQTSTGQDTAHLRSTPRTWRYLSDHAGLFSARKSRIYRNRPRFCIFGVGPYTFAQYKVAVSALHAVPIFRVLAPVDGRPVVPDDTVAFIGCDTEARARDLASRFGSPAALDFYSSQVFEGTKRPITISLLGRLDPEKLG
jgi:hypothetical protein